jgi:hypothetical protein
METRETVSINLRLPAELHAILTAIAAQDRRSVNQTLLLLIEQEQRRRSSLEETAHSRAGDEKYQGAGGGLKHNANHDQ